MDKCFLNLANIPYPDKCDCGYTASGNPYCSYKCNPVEHKKLMTENCQAHKRFNKRFGNKRGLTA